MVPDLPTARGLLLIVLAAGCLPDNPPTSGDSDGETGSDTATTDGTETSGDSGVPPPGGMLGCPAGETCTLVLVSQTLDDRLEVFSPGDPRGAVYRGAIDLDFKPNDLDGGYDGEKLDEPYGLSMAGGHLHVLIGHHPAQDEGRLLSLPYAFFADYDAGDTVRVDRIFVGGAFTDAVVTQALGELEPILLLDHAPSGRMLVAVFNNHLYDAETNWTNTSTLLVLDPADPQAAPGRVDLAGLEGGDCAGAWQIVDLGGDAVGVACDGNERVAVLDVSGLGEGSLADAAASVTGRVCTLAAGTQKRVRYLAPDGAGGFVALQGPGANVLDDAKLHRMDRSCNLLGITDLGSAGESQPNAIRRFPSDVPTWIVASGAGQIPSGKRGVFVVHDTGGSSLEICGPIAGFDEHWETAAGGSLDPFALEVAADGRHLAVGASPWFPAPSGDPGYGKVLWATLSGTDDPCTMTATVEDLTAHAPAVSPNDTFTWRRAPNVIAIQELAG